MTVTGIEPTVSEATRSVGPTALLQFGVTQVVRTVAVIVGISQVSELAAEMRTEAHGAAHLCAVTQRQCCDVVREVGHPRVLVCIATRCPQVRSDVLRVQRTVLP